MPCEMCKVKLQLNMKMVAEFHNRIAQLEAEVARLTEENRVLQPPPPRREPLDWSLPCGGDHGIINFCEICKG